MAQQDESSYEGDLPNKEPQAPRSISIEEADRGSRKGNEPYNPGGENHIACGSLADTPRK
jgi:hypothetical protein